jgi:hypothetical protein
MSKRVPYTKGKKAEGPKRTSGKFTRGTGGHTSAGTAGGAMVAAPPTMMPPAPMP